LGLIPVNILNLPVLLGSLILFIQGKKENVNLQRFAKVLLFVALFKSFILALGFLFYLREYFSYSSNNPNDEFKTIMQVITIALGINTAVDLGTSYLCLLVVRRTNEYLNLISRKSFFEFRTIIDGENTA